MLETELGVTLFERDPRSVRLTLAGERLRDRAEPLVAAAEATFEELRALSTQSQPRLHVGVAAGGAGVLTQPIVSAFHETTPGVTPVVRELALTEQVTALLDGDVDVVLARVPYGDERVALAPLFSEPRAALVGLAHPLADVASVAVGDLLGEAFVEIAGAPPGWSDFWSLREQRGAPARFAVSAATHAEALSAVAYGGAVATTCAAVAREAATSWPLRAVPIDGAPPSVAVVATRAGTTRPAVRRFVAVAREVAANRLDEVAGGWPPDSDHVLLRDQPILRA